MNGNKPPAGSRYFCRACGGPLPDGWHGQFHPQCLKEDKRRRTREKRRVERERFQAWLRHQRCPECGAALSRTSPPVSHALADADQLSEHKHSWAIAPAAEPCS